MISIQIKFQQQKVPTDLSYFFLVMIPKHIFFRGPDYLHVISCWYYYCISLLY